MPRIETALESTRQLHIWVLLVLATCLSLACNGDPHAGSSTVTGKVTLNHKPLAPETAKGSPPALGFVGFYGRDNLSWTAPIGLDSTYVISNIPTGQVGVGLEPPSERLTKEVVIAQIKAKKASGSQADASKTKSKDQWLVIPPRYRYRDKSGITYEVQAGTQTFDINLTP